MSYSISQEITLYNDMERTWLNKEWSSRINTLQIHLISTKLEYISVSVKLDWEGEKKKSSHRLWFCRITLQGHFRYKLEGFLRKKSHILSLLGKHSSTHIVSGCFPEHPCQSKSLKWSSVWEKSALHRLKKKSLLVKFPLFAQIHFQYHFPVSLKYNPTAGKQGSATLGGRSWLQRSCKLGERIKKKINHPLILLQE